MNYPETFLHFIWQQQHFLTDTLETTCGQAVRVLAVGAHNTHAGADFEAARVYIGEQLWVGNIEIHHDAREWETHGHHQDEAYNAVILHVVWQAPENYLTRRADGTTIPTLCLQGRVPQRSVLRFEEFLHNKNEVPCAAYSGQLPDSDKEKALREALAERLERKSEEVLLRLEQNQMDWEETFYQLLGKSYGFKVNALPFLELTTALPLRLIQKHRTNSLQVEALVLGQSGFLEGAFEPPYPQELQREYRFLEHKYDLSDKKLSARQWKNARVRPHNAPLTRLLQFSGLLQQHQLLFSRMTEAEDIKALLPLFEIAPNDFWSEYATPERPRKKAGFPRMSAQARQSILINALIPTLWARAKATNQEELSAKTLRLLSQMIPEENHITRKWDALGWRLPTAAQTQGALELYHEFCSQKRCLSCQVGKKLLRVR